MRGPIGAALTVFSRPVDVSVVDTPCQLTRVPHLAEVVDPAAADHQAIARRTRACMESSLVVRFLQMA